MRKKKTVLLAMDSSVSLEAAERVKAQLSKLLPEMDILVISHCNGITVIKSE